MGNGAVAPAKTPEVLAAEHAHFAAKGLPLAGYYGGLYGGAYNGLWNGYAGAYNGWAGYGYAGYPGYAGAYAGWGYPYAPALVGHPNGAVVPAEPADVVAARAEHLAAHGAPLVAPVAPVAEAIAPYYAPGFAGLVAHPNGALVPAELCPQQSRISASFRLHQSPSYYCLCAKLSPEQRLQPLSASKLFFFALPGP